LPELGESSAVLVIFLRGKRRASPNAAEEAGGAQKRYATSRKAPTGKQGRRLGAVDLLGIVSEGVDSSSEFHGRSVDPIQEDNEIGQGCVGRTSVSRLRARLLISRDQMHDSCIVATRQRQLADARAGSVLNMLDFAD
jgi:hypothetical protein